jgi:hypothetical protein
MDMNYKISYTVTKGRQIPMNLDSEFALACHFSLSGVFSMSCCYLLYCFYMKLVYEECVEHGLISH